jgi:hypothetical protein
VISGCEPSRTRKSVFDVDFFVLEQAFHCRSKLFIGDALRVRLRRENRWRVSSPFGVDYVSAIPVEALHKRQENVIGFLLDGQAPQNSAQRAKLQGEIAKA